MPSQRLWKSFLTLLQKTQVTPLIDLGMNPIVVVTELRNKHSKGDKFAGISVKKGMVNSNIKEENVLQPALVTTSALTLATEVVRMILKIDDVVMTAR